MTKALLAARAALAVSIPRLVAQRPPENAVTALMAEPEWAHARRIQNLVDAGLVEYEGYADGVLRYRPLADPELVLMALAGGVAS